MGQFVGDTVLTSPIWNFGPYYTRVVREAMNGEWETHQFWGGIDTEIVKLAEMSPLVPQDVRDLVDAEREKIVSGEWDVFWGPLKNRKGEVVAAEGEKMSDQEMLNMNFFVEGVEGTLDD